MKNGGILPLTPGEVSGHFGMTLDFSLVFNIIEFSDQGVYTCKASNINGEATNSTTVKVVRKYDISTRQITLNINLSIL
jgi:Cu/Ag efflux protein CusF